MKGKIVEILKKGGIEPNEAICEAELILEKADGISREGLLRGEDIQNINRVLEIANERSKSRKPIQYLLGLADFMGEEFIVTPDVLIPRAETEILVDEALKLIKIHNFKTVLDIGVGSACVACMVAKGSDCEVLGVDVSLEAMDVAIRNVQKLNLIRRVLIRKSDLFSNVGEKFDLIVSNPPYIPYSEKKNIQREVQYEPEGALFAQDNGLEFYKKIIAEAPKYINNGGFLIFEVGVNQAQKVASLLNEFENVQIIKDLSGIERVVKAQKKAG